jgi:hypothetical protein
MKDYEKIVELAVTKFRFKYIGGGYFRDKTVPAGKKAEILHGDEAIEAFSKVLIETLQTC